MARIVKYIFICFLAVFLMSHNTSAVDYNINVQRFCYIRSSEYFSRRWGNNGAVGTTLSLDGPNNWYYLYLTGNMYSGCSDPARGDIIQINFTLANMTENNSLDAYVWSFDDDYNGTVKVWEFIDYEFQMLDSSTSTLKLYYAYTGNGSIPGIDITPVGSRIGSIFNSETIIFNNIVMFRPVSQQDMSGVESAISGVTEAIEDLKDSVNNQEEAITDVQEEAETATDDAQADITGASTNFIGALGTIIDVFKNAEPGNCNITFSATTSGLSSFMGSIGTVNLCSQVPESILNIARVLASLVITPVVLLCAYSLVNTMYKMFNEVQE